jgi:alkanesulfonate monooxygenase SsuD/methylene tetrahydromethanopterin reductase-like flavin-dependent oxidoreductase (luciferase family)
MYRQLWAESGHRPGAEQVQVAQFCYVAEDGSEARAGYERIAKRYLQMFADACMAWQGRSLEQYPGYDTMVASIMATTPEKIIANGGAFVGTPDEVAEQVRVCIAAFGPIEPSMQINFGGAQEAEAFRTLDLFATKVMPRFGS